MKITTREVAHVAQLARLSFGEEQLERFARELNAILSYMDQLNEIDTSSVEPTTHALDLFNVFRDDSVVPSISVEEALSNAPKRLGGAFQVPRVIE